MSRLTVASPGPIAIRDGAARLADKTVSGVRAYAERWPGEVTLAAALSSDAQGVGNLGARWYPVDDLPFEVVVAPSLPEAIAKTRPDLVLANLTGRLEDLEDVVDKCVLLSEFDPWMRSKEAWHNTQGFARARAVAGAVRRTVRYRQFVRRARGLQCNGVPAYRGMAKYNTASMLFFDSRLGADDVAAAVASQRQDIGPRVAFSGRLHPDKGPEYLIPLGAQLDQIGVELDVFGDGVLRRELEDATGPNVIFHGDVDYEKVWLPYVRSNVDLMVLPHTQSDPSCTYLEAIGSGVPVLGFDNAALQSLVDRFNVGWTVPMRDGAALARTAKALLLAPDAIAAARDAGLSMMRTHHADATFDARVEHMKSLV